MKSSPMRCLIFQFTSVLLINHSMTYINFDRWALSYLSEGDNSRIQAVIDAVSSALIYVFFSAYSIFFLNRE